MDEVIRLAIGRLVEGRRTNTIRYYSRSPEKRKAACRLISDCVCRRATTEFKEYTLCLGRRGTKLVYRSAPPPAGEKRSGAHHRRIRHAS